MDLSRGKPSVTLTPIPSTGFRKSELKAFGGHMMGLDFPPPPLYKAAYVCLQWYMIITYSKPQAVGVC